MRTIVVVVASGLIPAAGVWAATSSIAPIYESSAEIGYRFVDIAPSTRTMLGLRAGARSPDALFPAMARELERAAARRTGSGDAGSVRRPVHFDTTDAIASPGQAPRPQGVVVAAQARTASGANSLANALAIEYVRLRKRRIEDRFTQLASLLRFQRSVLRGRDRRSAAAIADEIELAAQLEELERENASLRRRAVAAPERTAQHPWRNAVVMAAIGVLAALAFGFPQRLERIAASAAARRNPGGVLS